MRDTLTSWQPVMSIVISQSNRGWARVHYLLTNNYRGNQNYLIKSLANLDCSMTLIIQSQPGNKIILSFAGKQLKELSLTTTSVRRAQSTLHLVLSLPGEMLIFVKLEGRTQKNSDSVIGFFKIHHISSKIVSSGEYIWRISSLKHPKPNYLLIKLIDSGWGWINQWIFLSSW